MQRIVKLPISEPRCPDSRQKPCKQSGQCARALVAADQGRPLRDYSAERTAWAGCPGYLPVVHAQPVKQQTVHDAPQGLA